MLKNALKILCPVFLIVVISSNHLENHHRGKLQTYLIRDAAIEKNLVDGLKIKECMSRVIKKKINGSYLTKKIILRFLNERLRGYSQRVFDG